uniref:NADH dehydrogenase [ubiquinone] 1 beta subcomplex subunit 5, mitochondrial n=1 Tax=Vespula pensylvanica TaxID=30213 RepID=A0A834NRW2_VESPE|nr:hypothetical protein H0235_011165 [Vespula pensylvanica]
MIKNSRWQWSRCKDLVHFYVMLGVIPLSILTFCVNVFVGPATLEPIPEGYTPKPWEYYKHPITRFLVRYVYTPHQQDYEKYLNAVYLEQELRKIRQLQRRIEELIEQRNDYKYFYYTPSTAKYVHRANRAKNRPLIMISHSLQRSISELQPVIITRHKMKKEIYGGQPSPPVQTAQELYEEDSIETNYWLAGWLTGLTSTQTRATVSGHCQGQVSADLYLA